MSSRETNALRTSRGPRLLIALGAVGAASSLVGTLPSEAAPPTTPMVVFGYNDLGMHCMNSDFSEIMVLPPFNNLHAQVIRRGAVPSIVTGGVTVQYVIPGNTHSADKTNFWRYPQALLGNPLPDVGLTGNRLAGVMSVTTEGDWAATDLPITPIDDMWRENPYSLTTITVMQGSTLEARTQAVVPVSTEMSCILCHNRPGISTASDILQRHDELHGTNLMQQKPVLCASCHGSNALGLPGNPNLHNLSRAMHGAHAPRMNSVPQLTEVCYACHPGIRTKCQRDTHFSNGLTCTRCHGTMSAVADPSRIPWVTEPRCSNCHGDPGFDLEQPNTLFRNSVGHGGVHCEACHGSPHAITPTVTAVDNAQAINLAGQSGKIENCAVCHINQPSGDFFHRVNQ